MWRRYLKLAHGYTAAHPDGIVSYTAHELRHVCASLLIPLGLPTFRSPIRWATARSRPRKRTIYGHLFSQDRTAIKTLNRAVRFTLRSGPDLAYPPLFD
jgi:hypothetical protein